LLRRLNNEVADPVAVLGQMLTSYFDCEVPNPHTEVGESWETDRDRVLGELEIHGLRYTSGGAIASDAHPKRFREHQIYYMVWYIDPFRLCLQPEPVVFVARRGESIGGLSACEFWYFQDLDSYCAIRPHRIGRDRRENPSVAGHFTRLKRRDLFQVVDAHGLAYRLLRCEERRLMRRESNRGRIQFSADLVYYRMRYRDEGQHFLDVETLRFLGSKTGRAGDEHVFQFQHLSIEPEQADEDSPGSMSTEVHIESRGELIEVSASNANAIVGYRDLAAECEKCFARQARQF
jgi:hypothetical protein